MAFDWMEESTSRRRRTDDADTRTAMYRKELADRAGLYCRLGYAPSKAISRLKANLEWDFELAPETRPKGLSDSDITDIVKATYLRRPSR